MRLNRFLAAAGLASRRGADQLIAAGRVTVNGQLCKDFHFSPSATDHVKVDGKRVHLQPAVYLALHKPAGFVCTRRDPHTRDTVFDLLPPKYAKVFYIGRLDAASEGLLLLTNDGEFAEQLAHPGWKTEKEYEVTLDRAAPAEIAKHLTSGTRLDGKIARVAHARLTGPRRLRVVLTQGMNRQIRRMLEQLGFEVKRLVRTRIGHIYLHGLPRGKWRALAAHEVEAFKRRQQAPGRRSGR